MKKNSEKFLKNSLEIKNVEFKKKPTQEQEKKNKFMKDLLYFLNFKLEDFKAFDDPDKNTERYLFKLFELHKQLNEDGFEIMEEFSKKSINNNSLSSYELFTLDDFKLYLENYFNNINYTIVDAKLNFKLKHEFIMFFFYVPNIRLLIYKNRKHMQNILDEFDKNSFNKFEDYDKMFDKEHLLILTSVNYEICLIFDHAAQLYKDIDEYFSKVFKN